ncbi:50S ribosomal protein L24 [Candidatus Dojkabacteria bacterium]|nr:50S ribosomal protein L24 [Candidatus Dojkabacteria bacterium]
MKLKKGDTVKVLSGKYRGKTGDILKIFLAKNTAIVEKVNIVKKHKKKSANEKEPGGIIEVEAPVHISNLMLQCKNCLKFTRVGFRNDEKGKKVRYCKKCDKTI